MENKRNRDENDMYDKKRGDPSATAGLGPHPDQNNLDQDGKQKKAPDSKEDEKKRKKEEERRRKEEEKEKVNRYVKVTKLEEIWHSSSVGSSGAWDARNTKIGPCVQHVLKS